MSDGYRSIAFAALAVALLLAFGLGAYVTGLPNPQERYQPYQGSQSNEQGPLAAVANVAAGVMKRTPCQNPESETESDLCAQWRAAKAAEKAADWTLYGVIASAMGISLLLWQIVLTREAVKDTGHATVAMVRQNELTEIAQRPWLEIDIEFDFGTRTATGFILSFNVILRNIGKAPARDANIQNWVAPSHRNPKSEMEEMADAGFMGGEIYQSRMIVLPGGRSQDQELVFIERENEFDQTSRGIAPYLMISAFYKLPSGATAQTSAWFEIVDPHSILPGQVIRWDGSKHMSILQIKHLGYIKAT